MKKLFSTFVAITVVSTAPALAMHKGHDQEEKTAEKSTMPGIEGAACEDTIKVTVNGLICDFCARALEKVFGKQEEVSGIKVDLDNSLVTVAMKPGKKIDNEKLTKLITDSGYDVREIGKGC